MFRGSRGRLAAVALAGLLALAGCGGHGSTGGGGGTGQVGALRSSSIKITSPANDATDVSTATEIQFSTAHHTTPTIRLTDASGNAVAGGVRVNGSSWVPGTQLNYDTKYTITATGTGADAGTTTATFTTMSQPANLIGLHSWMGDGEVVGVGMPIALTFTKPIPQSMQAAVQRRLFVSSQPAQEGIWNWLSDTEVHYRPRQYWQPGTKLHVRAAIGGLDLGNGNYGKEDITVDASVGDKLLIEVDNNTKSLSVIQNGRVTKTMPVSLGKPAAPSSSGNMVIMIKDQWEWFDSSTFGIPITSPDGYRAKVYWDMRLTWGGQYIHAAPWSVADQGKTNVSHGCVNISTANAIWLYNIVKVGDPVIVSNTGAPLHWGDGWTDWNVSWDQYVRGSAIPYGPGSDATAPAGS